ncbi:Cell translocating kinase A N-terminus [Desulfosporosinus hippei DSM 8344]|uniref:Cell translocating kinase A N-terminus n=1 Tax=Desulfosporosinus hippei DSM 8344 TaxID=1121419 RepID=A0A1G8JSU2_9FIRM|nr:Cell translocating kinase A N-terminus [Desulfosporosinus hippei DSM 8344]
MVLIIDFTLCKVNKLRAYGGANGNKINILYEGNSYMLKFPPVPSRNKTMSYTNGCISEYLASISLHPSDSKPSRPCSVPILIHGGRKKW